MISNIIIQQVKELPTDFSNELLPASIREGFEPIMWLKDDWKSGKNKYNQFGEAFYIARFGNKLVGVCGVNRDPYSTDVSVCRLRRLYVLPSTRRIGVGRLIVEQAISIARNHFTTIRLRTLDDQSALFFKAVGFRETKNQKEATHEMRLIN